MHQWLTNVTINGSVRKVYDLGGRLLSFQYSNTVKGKNNRKYIIFCKYSQVPTVSTCAPKIQTRTCTSIFPWVTRTHESGYSRVFPWFYSQVLVKYLELWSALLETEACIKVTQHPTPHTCDFTLRRSSHHPGSVLFLFLDLPGAGTICQLRPIKGTVRKTQNISVWKSSPETTKRPGLDRDWTGQDW
jgi:hypothetical protein